MKKLFLALGLLGVPLVLFGGWGSVYTGRNPGSGGGGGGAGATNAIYTIQGLTNQQHWLVMSTNGLVPAISSSQGADKSTNTIINPKADRVSDGYLSSNNFGIFIGKQDSNAQLAALSATLSQGQLWGRFSAGSGTSQPIVISTGLTLDGSGNLTSSGSGGTNTTVQTNGVAVGANVGTFNFIPGQNSTVTGVVASGVVTLGVNVPGGTNAIVQTNGVNVGQVGTINLIAGANTTVTGVVASGVATIAVSSSAGGAADPTKMDATNGLAYGDHQIVNRFIRPPAKTITGTLTVTGTNSYTFETSTNFNWSPSGTSSNGQTLRFQVKNTNTTTDIFGTNSVGVFMHAVASNRNIFTIPSNSVWTIDIEYKTNFAGPAMWYDIVDNGKIPEIAVDASLTKTTNGNADTVTVGRAALTGAITAAAGANATFLAAGIVQSSNLVDMVDAIEVPMGSWFTNNLLGAHPSGASSSTFSNISDAYIFNDEWDTGLTVPPGMECGHDSTGDRRHLRRHQ